LQTLSDTALAVAGHAGLSFNNSTVQHLPTLDKKSKAVKNGGKRSP
jgi:hypothetical protein